MKRLCLLRHAKSCWRDADLDDADRPLNKRGRRDAPRMGAALGRRMEPLQFHCSPARRARLTFAGLSDGWPGLRPEHAVVEPALYTFAVGDLLAWLCRLPEPLPAVAIIGHNPALTDLVNAMAGAGTLANLPTAGWIELSLPINSWAEAAGCDGSGSVDFMLLPRSLADAA